MFNMKSKKPTGTPKPPNAFFIGGLLGAGIGYVAALFLAKQEGEKTQKQLKQKTQQVTDTVRSEFNKIQDKVSQSEDNETGKPSRINVNVEEKYDVRRRDPDVEVVEVKVEPEEDDNM